MDSFLTRHASEVKGTLRGFTKTRRYTISLKSREAIIVLLAAHSANPQELMEISE